MIDVIISPSFGSFEPNPRFKKFLNELGYHTFSDIKARTDERVIEFVKNHVGEKYEGIEVAFLGREKHQYLSIEKVDASKPWTIDNYDGAEYIRYLVVEVVDPELNYCKLICEK